MISNPCTWFATGGSYDDQREFTYEGGSKLFHFSPHDSGLSTNMEMNIIFFANNKEHAKDVLERMIKFRVQCYKDYKKATGQKHYSPFSSEEYPKMLLDNKNKWKITEAPTNQFYKVGWGCNDTIL